MKTASGGVLVARALKMNGINQVFALIGHHISLIFQGCAQEGIKIFDVRHEQAAAYMSDGWSKVAGSLGVAVMIGGPGFTNAITGILKAYFSYTPMLVIIGGIDPRLKDNNMTHDMDQLTVIRPYTKWCGRVYDTRRIPEYIAMAIRHALSGRLGPSVLEIPISYLQQKVDSETVFWPEKLRTDARVFGDESEIERAVELINRVERPMVIAGSGVYYSQGSKALEEFVEKSGIPTYTVYSGRGTLPDDHELAFGTGRVLEAGPQLYAFRKADLVIVLGASLDYTLGFGKPPAFGDNQSYIQVDINGAEIGSSGREIDVGIVGDCRSVLQSLTRKLCDSGLNTKKFAGWARELRSAEKEYWKNLIDEIDFEAKPIHPARLLMDINNVLPRDSITVVDGSNALMWGALLLKTYCPGHQIIGPDGTFGQMGAALPLAIAAKAAHPEKVVLVYTGDGSFGFNAIEIDTAVRLGIPVIVVVHNDGAWGFCRSTQEILYNTKNPPGTCLGYQRYDKLTESLGGYGELVEDPCDIVPALKRAIASGLPACINVIVDEKANSPGASRLNDFLKKIAENVGE